MSGHFGVFDSRITSVPYAPSDPSRSPVFDPFVGPSMPFCAAQGRTYGWDNRVNIPDLTNMNIFYPAPQPSTASAQLGGGGRSAPRTGDPPKFEELEGSWLEPPLPPFSTLVDGESNWILNKAGCLMDLTLPTPRPVPTCINSSGMHDPYSDYTHGGKDYTFILPRSDPYRSAAPMAGSSGGPANIVRGPPAPPPTPSVYGVEQDIDALVGRCVSMGGRPGPFLADLVSRDEVIEKLRAPKVPRNRPPVPGDKTPKFRLVLDWYGSDVKTAYEVILGYENGDFMPIDQIVRSVAEKIFLYLVAVQGSNLIPVKPAPPPDVFDPTTSHIKEWDLKRTPWEFIRLLGLVRSSRYNEWFPILGYTPPQGTSFEAAFSFNRHDNPDLFQNALLTVDILSGPCTKAAAYCRAPLSSADAATQAAARSKQVITMGEPSFSRARRGPPQMNVNPKTTPMVAAMGRKAWLYWLRQRQNAAMAAESLTPQPFPVAARMGPGFSERSRAEQ